MKMRRAIASVLVLLATALCLVKSQQYVPVQILIPSTIINQSAPAYGGPPRYNFSSSYNNSYGYNNSGLNNGYRPPGSYLGNQYPNYPQFKSNGTYPASYNGSQDGHLFLGQIQLYDRLLFNQVFRKESRWWTSRDKTIEYPSAVPAGYTRNEIISAIRVYNQFLDGNSAKASILKGGVGYHYVKLHLESQWNKGFQYLVQLYGH